MRFLSLLYNDSKIPKFLTFYLKISSNHLNILRILLIHIRYLIYRLRMRRSYILYPKIACLPHAWPWFLANPSTSLPFVSIDHFWNFVQWIASSHVRVRITQIWSFRSFGNGTGNGKHWTTDTISMTPALFFIKI